MRNDVPEKLERIVSDIKTKGPQNLTRLTVLKRWFDDPGRLAAFGIFMAKRASGRKGKVKGEEGALFRKARALLKDAPVSYPLIPAEPARELVKELWDFQHETRRIPWHTLRILKNYDLYLVEEGLRIYLQNRFNPQAGYRLAVSYCEHYDPSSGNGLDRVSAGRIKEILRFMLEYEAAVDGAPSEES